MTTGAVFIDLKKAFDLVNHECLRHKLEHYGVRRSTLDWFRSSHPIWCSAGQNSRASLFCFVLYINDLARCLEDCFTCMWMTLHDTVQLLVIWR